MKKFWVVMVAGGLVFSPLASGAEEEQKEKSSVETTEVKSVKLAEVKKDSATTMTKTSYAMGFLTGESLKSFDMEISIADFARGVEEGLKGEPTVMTREEIIETRRDLMRQRQEAQMQMRKVAGDKNLKEGQAFLAENKKKDGVITTESGLQYIVLKEGDGGKPKATDLVKVHYRGTLIDGTEFDSSYNRGEPTKFMANRVIKGWTEGLQLMKVGGKCKFFIPSELAYGDRGAGADIGPNAVLIFEVELLGIEDTPNTTP